MKNNSLYSKTLKEIGSLLRRGKVSLKDLVDETFRNIEVREPKIKAFLTLIKETDIKKVFDISKNRKNERRILEGIPFSVKDNLCTKGIRTTAGSKILEDFVSPYDATVVGRCKNAGGVIIGKTNLDEFGHGFTTEASAFQTTLNPWDFNRLPGGSSGGSAAAVATGMGFFSLATENWDSIRMPAAVCGVVGIKPT